MHKQINELMQISGLQRPIRAKSMIATIFGDVIEIHGGRIWLSDLIKLASHFAINERLVRTSVFRLVEEGWLKKTRQGRRSVYELTIDGQEQTTLAGELIYHYKQKPWNGAWDLVIATSTGISAEKNLQLQRRLSLMGFGTLAKNIYAHPDMDNQLVNHVIDELGLVDQVFIMESSFGSDSNAHIRGLHNREMVNQCCAYDEVVTMYEQFISAYKPILKQLTRSGNIQAPHCFSIQMLLMHDYRRLLFKDPQLPVELLPGEWVGLKARELVKNIYTLTYKSTNTFYAGLCDSNALSQILKPSFYDRFGGLPDR